MWSCLSSAPPISLSLRSFCSPFTSSPGVFLLFFFFFFVQRLWNVPEWMDCGEWRHEWPADIISVFAVRKSERLTSSTLKKQNINVYLTTILTAGVSNCFFFHLLFHCFPCYPARGKKNNNKGVQDEVDRSGWEESSWLIARSPFLIWSRRAVIVMKHRWRRAKKSEDYTAWAIHGTIHPFIALGFPHSQSRK